MAQPKILTPIGVLGTAHNRYEDRAPLLTRKAQGNSATQQDIVVFPKRSWTRLTALITFDKGDNYIGADNAYDWNIAGWWGDTSGSWYTQNLSSGMGHFAADRGYCAWYLDITRSDNNWWAGEIIFHAASGHAYFGNIMGGEASGDTIGIRFRNLAPNYWTLSETVYV